MGVLPLIPVSVPPLFLIPIDVYARDVHCEIAIGIAGSPDP
jgi:hypothetical protein